MRGSYTRYIMQRAIIATIQQQAEQARALEKERQELARARATNLGKKLNTLADLQKRSKSR